MENIFYGGGFWRGRNIGEVKNGQPKQIFPYLQNDTINNSKKLFTLALSENIETSYTIYILKISNQIYENVESIKHHHILKINIGYVPWYISIDIYH